MKTMLSLFAVAAVLLTGCGGPAQASPPVPNSPAPVTAPDYLKPTGPAVAPCDPDSCDPDEGETIDPAELAALDTPVATATGRPHYEEDDPQWDCYLDGNKICGPKTEGLAVEAWKSFDVATFVAALPADVQAKPFRVTYQGTAKAGVDLPPSKYATFHSSRPGIDHAFRIEFGVTAP